MALAAIFSSIFFDVDPTKTFSLRQAARTVAQQLGNIVESHVKSVGSSGFLSSIVNTFRHHEEGLSNYGVQMIRGLLDNDLGVSEVTWSHILPTICALVPNLSEVVSFSCPCPP